jgi:curved DNA-binding protein CbpA
MEFARQFIKIVSESGTGNITAKEGNKQWVFYFSNGKLVQTRSNLKSEQGAALKKLYPNDTVPELLHKQAVSRAQKACGKLVQLSFEADGATKKSALRTLDVLLDSASFAYGEETLKEACGPIADERISIEGEILFEEDSCSAFLGAIDGGKSGHRYVQGSGLEPQKAWCALWIAQELGNLSSAEEDQGDALFDFDLDSLLEEADELEAGEQGEVASGEVASGEQGAEGPKTETETETGEASEDADEDTWDEPSEEEEEKEQEHPLKAKLDELETRMDGAANHFEVLGVKWDDPVESSRKAYRDLSLLLHPDRYVDATEEMQETATQLFDKIRVAWEVLGDEEARKAYIDKEIHGIKTEEDEAMEHLQAYWAAEEAFKRGMALFNQGRLGPAHENFTKAVESFPEELEFKAYWGYTTFATHRASDMEKAMDGIDIIKEVIDLNQMQEKKLDKAWMLIGRAYRELGETEKAKRALTQALRINPSNSDALRELKRIQGQGGKPGSKGKGKSKGKDKKDKKTGFWGGLFGKKK